MRIATFNVNGISARLPRLLEWLESTRPDAVCLQEIKCTDDTFPAEPIRALGYTLETVGQKSFNGVAILSRLPFRVTQRALSGDASDEQARYVEADFGSWIFGGLYLPNGNPQPGPKFDYKLGWMRRLITHAASLLETEKPVVLAGDYNVCPTDDDLYSPAAMADDALVQPESRAAFRELCALGLTDAIRAVAPSGRVYTFWDYQAGAWAKDHGLRIDHLLLSPQAADRLVDAGVDRKARAAERPSDHAPVWVELMF